MQIPNMKTLTDIAQLDGEQRELAEIIGLEAYRKLADSYAGCTIYVRKPEEITKKLRNAEICEKFDGKNYRELARDYQLSESSIRKIVRRVGRK